MDLWPGFDPVNYLKCEKGPSQLVRAISIYTMDASATGRLSGRDCTVCRVVKPQSAFSAQARLPRRRALPHLPLLPNNPV